MEIVFNLGNLLVLPFWVLMIFIPRWRWTERVMKNSLVIALPALLYTLLVVPRLLEIFPALLRPELHTIAALLGSPEGATIGWTHFLAFDLFVGHWIYRDSRLRNFSVWLMGPILFLTLMLGPVGFLLYLITKQSIQRVQSH
jgi:hypothetical protein